MSTVRELGKGSAVLVAQTALAINLAVAAVRGTIEGWRDFGAMSLIIPLIDIFYITKYTVVNVIDLIGQVS